MPRKRLYRDNAARQKAYRSRIFTRYGATEWQIRFAGLIVNTADYLGMKDEIEKKLISGELTSREAASILRTKLAVIELERGKER